MGEDALLVGEFVVDPDIVAVVVVRVGSIRKKVILIAAAHAGLVGQRIQREQRHSHRVESRGGNDIAGKWRANPVIERGRIIDNQLRAIGVESLREIAGFFQGGGHGGRETGAGRAVAKLLVGEEEESLVAPVVELGNDYRAAYLASKLVSCKRRLCLARSVGIIAIGIER